jgi:hypothetical protein
MKTMAVGSRHLHRIPAGLWTGYSSNGRYYSVDCLYSSSELASQSRARRQGSDQPLPEAIAVEKESVLRDASTIVRTGFSKPFSKAGTAFLVEVFAGGKKVVRR